MSPGDYQLDPFEARGTIDLADELEEGTVASRRRLPWLVGGVLLLVLGSFWAVWYFTRGEEPVAAPVASPTAPETLPEPIEREVVDLPALAASDTWLRDVVGQLSEHPQLVTWLLNEDLIRRLVATTANLAQGESPRPHVRFLQPSGEFSVIEEGGRLTADSASYRRYQTLVGVVTSLHVEGTAQVYRNVKPLLDEAYRELGYPDGDFDVVAAQAVNVLLDTPVLDDLEIERFASSFKYADSRLEGMSEAQKHFLRLGPENLRAIQNHVRRVALRAGLVLD